MPPRRDGATNATLVQRERVTRDIDRLVLRPDEPMRSFIPGQYVSLGLARDGGLLQRPYSPANPPAEDDALEFLIRRVPGGRLTPILWETPVGARLRIGPAKGLFRLAPGDRRTHLFVATGTGLAPLVAMAAALLREQEPPPVVLVHGARHEQELAFRHRIEGWTRESPKVAYLPAVSRPSATWRAGDHILAGRVLDLMPHLWSSLSIEPARTVAYLCGNPSVVRGIGRFLEATGLDPSAIHREEYWPAA